MLSTNRMLALQLRTRAAFERVVERMKDAERGQTAVEYAGIAFFVALVAVALIGKNSAIGSLIFGKISEAIGKIT